jgi:hypothetical protein
VVAETVAEDTAAIPGSAALRAWRRLLGLSQRQAAAALGTVAAGLAGYTGGPLAMRGPTWPERRKGWTIVLTGWALCTLALDRLFRDLLL